MSQEVFRYSRKVNIDPPYCMYRTIRVQYSRTTYICIYDVMEHPTAGFESCISHNDPRTWSLWTSVKCEFGCIEEKNLRKQKFICVSRLWLISRVELQPSNLNMPASNGWQFASLHIQWLAVFLPLHPMVGSFLTNASNGWQFSYHCIQWLEVFLPLHPMVGSFLTTATRWFNPSQYSPTFETWIYLQTCMFRAYKNVASICFADSVLQNLVISYLKFLFWSLHIEF